MVRFFTLAIVFIAVLTGACATYMYVERVRFASLLLTKALDTPVSVRDFSIDRSGVRIDGLVIQNIEAAKIQPALSVQTVRIGINWWNLLKAYVGCAQPASIDSLVMIGSEVAFEYFSLGTADTNWTRLFRSCKGTSASRKFIVRHISLQNVTIRVCSHFLKIIKPTVSANIREIELHDLDTKDGVSTGEVFRIVVQAILDKSLQALKLPFLKGEKKAV